MATENGQLASKPQFTLHTHHTCPAAFKVAHVLSLLHLTYEPKYRIITKTAKEPKEPWFIALNPNGRLPVLIDHAQNDHVVWESGAIIHYLLTLYDKENLLWPANVFKQSKVNQWHQLQISGQGPTIGQAFWFGYWHHEVLDSAYVRYVDETKRILGVLTLGLDGGKKEWLVDEKMSIADVSFLSWYEEAFMVDVDIEKEYPVVHAWLEKMRAVPEIIQGSIGREMIQPKKIWEREHYVKKS